MTFNGMNHRGSFDAALKNARARSRTRLVDVRNESFMAARAPRHSADKREFTVDAELLPHSQRWIGERRLSR
jgi:hypothetical protein